VGENNHELWALDHRFLGRLTGSRMWSTWYSFDTAAENKRSSARLAVWSASGYCGGKKSLDV